MKKVAMITANPLALPVFFTSQTQFLRANGIDILTISSPGRELQEFGKSTSAAVAEVPMSRRITPLADLVAVWRLFRELRAYRPDIVHAHMPKGGLLGMSAAVLAGVPVRYFTVHGLRSETEKGLRSLLVRGAERLTLALSTEAFAVSDSLRTSIVEAGNCNPAKISVLGRGGCAGVDTTRFDSALRAPDRQRTRARYQIPQSSVTICYAGRVAQAKGIADLHEAWLILSAEFPRLHLLICGPIDEEDPIAPAILKSLQAHPRVRLTGALVTDMPAIYAAADLCVLPSYREGLGVVALEAAAMQKPTVAYNTGGLADAIRDGETGWLVPNGDRTALTAALRELIRDPVERSEMGIIGRRFVQEYFEASQVSRRLFEKYANPRRTDALAVAGVRRMLDVLLAVVIGVMTLPLLCAVMAMIRLSLGSPVIFRQDRGGMGGVPFTLYKLRTMTDSLDSAGNSLPDSSRLTWLGRLLRASSIDELPQIWNVLRGDMSFVGPRPLLTRYLSRYSDFEARRHEVRPGITGWTQVSGRNSLSWDEAFERDVWYVEHRSLGLDARILAMTLLRMIRPSGIDAAEGPGRPEFLGHSGKASAAAIVGAGGPSNNTPNSTGLTF